MPAILLSLLLFVSAVTAQRLPPNYPLVPPEKIGCFLANINSDAWHSTWRNDDASAEIVGVGTSTVVHVWNSTVHAFNGLVVARKSAAFSTIQLYNDGIEQPYGWSSVPTCIAPVDTYEGLEGFLTLNLRGDFTSVGIVSVTHNPVRLDRVIPDPSGLSFKAVDCTLFECDSASFCDSDVLEQVCDALTRVLTQGIAFSRVMHASHNDRLVIHVPRTSTERIRHRPTMVTLAFTADVHVPHSYLPTPAAF